MPNSYVEYTTSGTGTNGLGQRVFTAPTLFRHIDDIRAKGLSGSTWTELSISARGTTTVTLSAVPTGKSKVRIYRQTPADPLVDFTKGATLTAADLDSAYNQGLLLSQEVAEQADPSGGSGISGIDSAQLASNLSLGGTTTTNSITCNGTLNLHGNNSVTGERVGTVDTLAVYSNDEVDLRIGSNSSSQAALKVEQVGSGTSAKITAPLTTNANITSAGNKALITKEYADATYVDTNGMKLLDSYTVTATTQTADIDFNLVFADNTQYDIFKVYFSWLPNADSTDDSSLRFFLRNPNTSGTPYLATTDYYTYGVHDLENNTGDGENNNADYIRFYRNDRGRGDANTPARRYISGEFTMFNPMNSSIMATLRGQSASYWGSGTPTHNYFEFAGGLDESSVTSGQHRMVTGLNFLVNNSNPVRQGTWVKIFGVG